MLDIRVDASFFDHPKVRRLERLVPGGALALLALWCFLRRDLSRVETGSLAGLDPEDLEDLARWRGEPGAMIPLLIELGWLDVTDDGLVAHQWAEHQPYAVAARARSIAAQKAAQARWAKEATGKVNTEQTGASCGAHAGRMPAAMPPTLPNQTNQKTAPTHARTPARARDTREAKERIQGTAVRDTTSPQTRAAIERRLSASPEAIAEEAERSRARARAIRLELERAHLARPTWPTALERRADGSPMRTLAPGASDGRLGGHTGGAPEAYAPVVTRDFDLAVGFE